MRSSKLPLVKPGLLRPPQSIPCQLASVTHCFLLILLATNDLSVNVWHLIIMSFLLIPNFPKLLTSTSLICCFLPARPEIMRYPSTHPQCMASDSISTHESEEHPESTGQGKSKPTSFTSRTKPSCVHALISQSQKLKENKSSTHHPILKWGDR